MADVGRVGPVDHEIAREPTAMVGGGVRARRTGRLVKLLMGLERTPELL